MATRALVIGGSGATGVHVVEGLAARGYEVAILHRGVHEDPALDGFRHLHADPHFADELKHGLGGETFDVVVAMYGRLEIIAGVFAGRCKRFVGIGGSPIYAGVLAPDSVAPHGMALHAAESSALADPATIANERTARFVAKLRAAEAAVIEGHSAGHFWATHIRYPLIYGPHSLRPVEWSIVKRVLDGRRQLLLPDAGLSITSRCAAANAAHCVLLALETPSAGGEVFNCADQQQFSMSQWAEIVAGALGGALEHVDVPEPLQWLVAHLMLGSGTASKHTFLDTGKAQEMLGYRDVVPAHEALAETARTLAQAPPGPDQVAALGDRFDYALEDRVIARLTGLSAEFAVEAWLPEHVHAYAHPVAPRVGSDHRGR